MELMTTIILNTTVVYTYLRFLISSILSLGSPNNACSCVCVSTVINTIMLDIKNLTNMSRARDIVFDFLQKVLIKIFLQWNKYIVCKLFYLQYIPKSTVLLMTICG